MKTTKNKLDNSSNVSNKNAVGRIGPMGRITVEKPKEFKKSMKALFEYLKPFKILIIVSILFAALGTIFNLVGPQIIKEMGTVILEGSILRNVDMAQILYFAVLLAILYVVASIFSVVQGFIMASVTAKVSKNLRNEISLKINKLPFKVFDKQSYGDILSRITNDVDLISQTLNDSLSQIITSVTLVIGVIIMMFINSVPLAVIAIVGTPLSMVCVLIIIKLSQKYFAEQQKGLGEINGHIEEIYSAHNVVVTYNGQESASKKFDKINEHLFSSSYKAQFLSGMMYPISSFIGNIVYVVIALVGGSIAIDNPIFAVTIVAFITYLRMFNQQVSQVASVANTLQSTAAASERVFEFLKLEEVSEQKEGKQIENFKGNVEFKDVCFGYEKDKQIIYNFSASIKAGSKVAIVGPTGAGKTTIVNLLMRFYEIDSGDILIDGISIKEMTRSEVRELFGMVLQDTWLFEGTIRENISYGTEGQSNEQIENACCFAHIDHFIRSLPNGYDMILDENANISQGQKQLLTIARAMVHNSPILILDEATSSVDTRTEIMIQKAMDKLMEGRTSFVIAHRLSTIKNADLILVLKDGNIIEYGNHNKLLAANGFYAELYNSQFTREHKEGEGENLC